MTNAELSSLAAALRVERGKASMGLAGIILHAVAVVAESVAKVRAEAVPVLAAPKAAPQKVGGK